MPIELAQLRNGAIALLTDLDLADKVSSVEYFKEQNYLQLSYEKETLEALLLHEDLSQDALMAIECALDMIYVVEILDDTIDGYYVPFTRID